MYVPAPLPLDPVRLEHFGQVRRAPRRRRGDVKGADGGDGLRTVIRRRGRRFLLAEERKKLSLNRPLRFFISVFKSTFIGDSRVMSHVVVVKELI